MQLLLPAAFFVSDMQLPERHIAIADCLKATPVEEGGERFIYCEASNEARDIQNEIVLAQALEESAPYFLRYGNLDLDHYTQIGARLGIPSYELYEIGQPVDVRVDGSRTFVKGKLYQGDGPAAERANAFWDSIANTSPAHRWYPSIGGKYIDAEAQFDPDSRRKVNVVSRIRWTNIGFSKTPVNDAVPTVATVPLGALAKCRVAGGFDLAKALEAGYGTDVANLQGGGALREQSLYGAPVSYWDFRERLASDLREDRLKSCRAGDLVDHATHQYGLPRDDSVKWVGRFLSDLKRRLHR